MYFILHWIGFCFSQDIFEVLQESFPIIDELTCYTDEFSVSEWKFQFQREILCYT